MNTYIMHHGIKGQKWGVRRYQNADGSLTDQSRRKYGKEAAKKYYKIDKMKRRRENTHISFGKYQRLGKKIRVQKTHMDRTEAGLIKYDIVTGRRKVASFRSKTYTLGAIGSAALVDLGVATVGSMGLLGVPVVALGGIALGKAASRQHFYSRESKAYKDAQRAHEDRGSDKK